MTTTLVETLTAAEAEATKECFRLYREIVDRADNPHPKDTQTMAQLMERLMIGPEDVAADIETWKRHKAHVAALVPAADVEAATKALREAGDALEQHERESLARRNELVGRRDAAFAIRQGMTTHNYTAGNTIADLRRNNPRLFADK